MSAIYGLIGEGDLDVVRGMGQRMEHRGPYERAWSPSSGVFFGMRGSRSGYLLELNATLKRL